MDATLYTIAILLFLLAPIFLLTGLIRPQLFKRLTKGTQSRKRLVLYALALFSISIVLAGIFEPDSVKHDRLVREQQSAIQAKQDKLAATAKEQKKILSKSISTKTVAITAIENQKDGYAISGTGTAGQKVEVQTADHKKYKATVTQSGKFKTGLIKKLPPYGSATVSTLKRSFLTTTATKKQMQYYSLFAIKPVLSTKKISAVITKLKKDGNNFKLEGFYLPSSSINLENNGIQLSKVSTNKDGFFVFSNLHLSGETAIFTVKAAGSPDANKHAYLPRLSLLDIAPEIKTIQTTEAIPFLNTNQDSPSLAKGKTKVTVAGQDGIKTHTYTVFYIHGKEVGRKQSSEAITIQPITQVTQVGTYVYVAPTPTITYTAPKTTSGGRVGATCRDGSHSNATGSGACSHHGGVAVWLYD